MCGRYVLFSTPEQLVEAVRRRTGQQRVAMVGEGRGRITTLRPLIRCRCCGCFVGCRL